MKKIAVIGYGAFARDIMCNIDYPLDIFFYGNYYAKKYKLLYIYR